jgi:hypothetical protein
MAFSSGVSSNLAKGEGSEGPEGPEGPVRMWILAHLVGQIPSSYYTRTKVVPLYLFGASHNLQPSCFLRITDYFLQPLK